jgi:hypothetical protein
MARSEGLRIPWKHGTGLPGLCVIRKHAKQKIERASPTMFADAGEIDVLTLSSLTEAASVGKTDNIGGTAFPLHKLRALCRGRFASVGKPNNIIAKDAQV